MLRKCHLSTSLLAGELSMCFASGEFGWQQLPLQRSDWRARVKGDPQLDRFAAVGAIKSLGLRHDGTSQRPLFLLAVRDTA